MSASHTQRLKALGAKRDKINAQRTAVLAEMRAAIREAKAAGVSTGEIARAAGVSREAVRLTLKD